MGSKIFASMNIAVIGAGKMAELYAMAFARAGHQVFMAWKERPGRNVRPVLRTLENIHFCSIEEASHAADLVVMAAPPKDVRELSYWLGDVRNKVIIDLTSNIFTGSDELIKTVCAIKSITGSQHIVKAFHTRGYEQLLKPLFNGEAIDIVIVGDSRKAKETLKILAADFNLTRFYDFGGTETIPLFNAMTHCWRDLVLQTAKDRNRVVPVKQPR